MTACPYTIKASETLEKAHEMMRLYKIRHIPVVEGDELVGVLTNNEIKLLDLICKSTGYCPTVGELHFDTPYVVLETAHLGSVAQIMAERHLHYALVEGENSELVGIVTTTDLCKAVHLLLGDT